MFGLIKKFFTCCGGIIAQTGNIEEKFNIEEYLVKHENTKLLIVDELLSDPTKWESKKTIFSDAVMHKEYDIWFYTDNDAYTIRNGNYDIVCGVDAKLFDRWKNYSRNIAEYLCLKRSRPIKNKPNAPLKKRVYNV